MTDKKISELTNITGANLADTDEFVVVDTSATETKAITWGELKEGLDTSTGFVRITGDTMTGDLTVPNIITSGNVDGRDVSADGTKLDGIEAGADVTDTTNVTAAGALMDSELTNITAVKALNQGVSTTDSPTFAGIDVTGTVTADGLTLGDNDKAIFGAGSDLQIYHDGGNSFIREAGTGILYIEGAGAIRLRGATTQENMIQASENGAVTLYYDNAAKLATTSIGIDVTGTVTADGLTVDGTTGVNVNGIYANVDLVETDITDQNTRLINAGGDFRIDTLNDAKTVSTKRLAIDHATGDISFYEDTGTTPKFFWDASAERLGIGTSSPSGTLTVTDGTDGLEIGNEGVAGTTRILAYDRTAGSEINLIQRAATHQFQTGGTERLRIDSSGNLLVGTTGTPGGAANGVMLSASGRGIFSRSAAASLLLYRPDSNGNITEFYKGATNVGSISVTGTATSYNTSSDYRLKEDVQPMTGASQRVLALNPVNFAWKADGTRVDGFLAHEAQAVVPEAVTGTKDAVDDEGNPDYQAIDQSKLVPLLTAALQEALQRIEALEAQLNP